MANQSNKLAAACRSFEEDLVLLHYGDLGGSERKAVETHVNGCAGCTAYLKELGKLLPLTIKADEPTQAFWDDYSRELRRKLDDAAEKRPWWHGLGDFFQPRLLSAFAGAAIVVIALAFTLGKGIWPTSDLTQDDEALIEALPVAENLEFFKTMDVLDNLDLLESMTGQANAA